MSSASRKLEAFGSAAKIMWALSTAPYPLTTRQCADRLGLDSTMSTHRKAVSQGLGRLLETGLVMRRQVPGQGAPHEYVINPEWEPEGVK